MIPAQYPLPLPFGLPAGNMYCTWFYNTSGKSQTEHLAHSLCIFLSAAVPLFSSLSTYIDAPVFNLLHEFEKKIYIYEFFIKLMINAFF